MNRLLSVCDQILNNGYNDEYAAAKAVIIFIRDGKEAALKYISETPHDIIFDRHLEFYKEAFEFTMPDTKEYVINLDAEETYNEYSQIHKAYLEMQNNEDIPSSPIHAKQ